MLIDSHCHLPHPKYKKSLKDLINDAKDAGVTKLINIGTSVENNLEVIKFVSDNSNSIGFVGVNGAGKTTTISIICGLLNATSGSINILGFDLFTQMS